MAHVVKMVITVLSVSVLKGTKDVFVARYLINASPYLVEMEFV